MRGLRCCEFFYRDLYVVDLCDAFCVVDRLYHLFDDFFLVTVLCLINESGFVGVDNCV